MFNTVAGEMVVRQPHQVNGADEHHEIDSDEIGRQQDGEDAEDERADDAVVERLFLLAFRKPEDEDGEDHGVVGAQQSFERDEQRDGYEISSSDFQDNCKC